MGNSEIVSLKEYMNTKCDERMRQYFTAVSSIEKRQDAVEELLTVKIEHTHEKLEDLERLIDHKFTNLSKTTESTAAAMEKRLEGMNEFRDTLKDQAGRFFTRDEHEAYRKVIDVEVRSLNEFRAELTGKASQASVNVTFVLAAIGALTGLLSLLIKLIKG